MKNKQKGHIDFLFILVMGMLSFLTILMFWNIVYEFKIKPNVPCERFKQLTVKDIPVRCLNELTK